MERVGAAAQDVLVNAVQWGPVANEPAAHTAEDATPGELWRASWKLLLMLAILGLIVIPLLRELPLGQSSKIGLLAWMLVVLGFYWLYAGMGSRPLLLLQLILFSGAATLLTAKLLLVAADVHTLAGLRHVARGLVLVGAGCAFVNLFAMLVLLWRRSRPRSAASDRRP